MDSLVTTALHARLGQVRDRETAILQSRTQRSARWLDDASDLMPNGVPMAWMTGFWRHRPVVAVSGRGSQFTDLDGNSYRDFNLCDLAMAAGFASPPIVRAIADQAARGNHFLLPTEDAVEVSRLLRERFGLPRWQYTLSASGATVDALRLARASTGRTKVLAFQGRHHGHVDELLATRDGPDAIGLAGRAGADVEAVPFNDLESLAAALERGEVDAYLDVAEQFLAPIT